MMSDFLTSFGVQLAFVTGKGILFAKRETIALVKSVVSDVRGRIESIRVIHPNPDGLGPRG